MHDIVAVVTDLFFQSRIAAASKAASRDITYVRSLTDIDDIESFACALVDLDAVLDVGEAIRRLRSVSPVPIVAFGPHVDTERRKAAKTAGADRVLAKSKFVTELPGIMRGQQHPSVSLDVLAEEMSNP